MKNDDDVHSELKAAVRAGRATFVIGTGVSIAASYDSVTKQPHPQASWVGLLQHGLEWLKSKTLMDAAEADAHLLLLKKNPQTSRLVSIAADVTTGMGGAGSKHFRDWLQQTIGSIKANDRRVLDALGAIGKQGNLLATTNYDCLLLGNPPTLMPVTWKDTAGLIEMVRQRQTDKVIYLHGHWRQPDSVILDWNSYEKIARNEDYRDDLTAVWKTSTWVYVGCGMNGLKDPDLGLLFERFAERARTAGHFDYCLVRNDQLHEFQAFFDQNKFNIRAVAFGNVHDDLAPYLQALLLDPSPQSLPAVEPSPANLTSSIPKPPDFYAEPDYIGSHKFVGRAAELQVLTDWAAPADPTNLLLFEAIGGNGKSMLTWEWTKNHAVAARPADSPWAGRFWYSFYERGAIMADFCQRTLAYMTCRPLEYYAKKKTAELKEELLAQLHARPWLLILDGLERVLVAYHRIDAAEVADEEANIPTDKIVNRNPCDAIRDEDNELLRALAAAAPSKFLVSSRLTPRVLLNPAGQTIPGVRRINLPGLRPPDAEALLRSCGIEGKSAAIQSYLASNCENHPLVIGILGGLIANYLPARGNFDNWSTADDGGAALDLASLDLIQRRNHILRAAIEALPDSSRQLLSTLALLTESVDYQTLKAFNPHLPLEPAEVEKPTPPEELTHRVDGKRVRWQQMSDEQKADPREQYEAALSHWRDYEKTVRTRQASTEFRSAPKLQATVRDLEQRGLLQWDGRERKYDLHPVVRGVASGGLATQDRERYGQRVVDHFTALPHLPYEQAATMEDLRSGLNVVRTLLKLGHFQQAVDVYRGDLSNALYFNLDAYTDALSLLRPFFPNGWGELPKDLKAFDGVYVVGDAAIALDYCGEKPAALAAYVAALRADLEAKNWIGTATQLRNISVSLADNTQVTQSLRSISLALEVATLSGNDEGVFISRLFLFTDQSSLGQWAEAASTWQLLDPMGRQWSRAVYRPGMAECRYAQFHFWQGTLQEDHLSKAECLAEEGKDRAGIRSLLRLRGDWRLEQGEWTLAVASFHEAVRLARERSLTDAKSEIGLALAKYQLGQLPTPRDEALRLAQLRDPENRYLAILWLAIGDIEQANRHALAAYKSAWAAGEPYVNRFELTKTTQLLQQMNVPVPNLPPYDQAKDEPLCWEADVRAAIEKLRAEKKAAKPSTN